MPIGEYKRIIKEKVCLKCGTVFSCLAHNAKYCNKCKNKSYRNCSYCNESFKIEQNTQIYCKKCKLLEIPCKCGCLQNISFMKWIKGITLIHGHNRRGFKKEKLFTPIKIQKIKIYPKCVICDNLVIRPQRKTCSRECFSKLNSNISKAKWLSGESKIHTGYVGIKGHIYNGIYLRSSWELEFAKYMDSKGIIWEYEPKRFNLGDCIYIPDFYIPSFNMFIEIKGWMQEKFLQKMEKMDKFHSGTNLLIINRPPPYDWVF